MPRGSGALEQFLGNQCIAFCVFQEWPNEETWEIEDISEESEEGWEFWVCCSSPELRFVQLLRSGSAMVEVTKM